MTEPRSADWRVEWTAQDGKVYTEPVRFLWNVSTEEEMSRIESDLIDRGRLSRADWDQTSSPGADLIAPRLDDAAITELVGTKEWEWVYPLGEIFVRLTKIQEPSGNGDGVRDELTVYRSVDDQMVEIAKLDIELIEDSEDYEYYDAELIRRGYPDAIWLDYTP